MAETDEGYYCHTWIYDQDTDWLVIKVHEMVAAMGDSDVAEYRMTHSYNTAIILAELVNDGAIDIDGITENGREHLSDFIFDYADEWIEGG